MKNRKKFKTWQHGLEETLELKAQEIKDHDKQTKDRKWSWKRCQSKYATAHTPDQQQRENNEDWKQDMENDLLKLINENKIQSRISKLQYKELI